MKKAVVYIRARNSINERKEQIESTRYQIDACLKYAHEKGFTVVDTYIEREILGETSERIEQARLLSDSKTQLWEAVIVTSVDRLSRDFHYYTKLRATLAKNGKRILTVGCDENDIDILELFSNFRKEKRK